MTSAVKLDGSLLLGKILLNIDLEEEGKLLVSCVGGVRTNILLDIEWKNAKEQSVMIEIILKGLKGGHSGMGINKERGNSNKLIGRILNDLLNKVEISLISLNEGSKNNDIAREVNAVIAINTKDIRKFKEIINS